MGAQVQNLDVPIVSWLAGPAQAGLLAAPSRLTSPIGIVASSVASILFVQRRHMMPATGPGAEGRPRAGATVGITAASAGLTAVIVSPLLVAPSWTMSLLLGSSYQGSGVTARLVAIGMCISALVQPLSADLQARHRHRSVAVSLLLAGLVGTLTVVLAAPTWGAVGGGVGVVMTQITAVAGLTAIRFRERLMIERCGDRSASSYPPDDQAAPAVARTAGLSPRRGVLGDGASPRRRSSR
jgi:O-antigen/teichoic acid export membrane protein